jgi:hypothetical protein
MTRTRQPLIPTVATVSEDAVYSQEEAPEQGFEEITEGQQDASPKDGCDNALAETAQHRPGGGSQVKAQESAPSTSSPEQGLQEQRQQRDCVSVTSSRESVCSWFEMRFQMETDAARFSCFVATTTAFALVYIM